MVEDPGRAPVLRTCSACGNTKPLTAEFFCPSWMYRGGFTPRCRVCINRASKEYKAAQRRARGARPDRRPRLIDGVEWWECKKPDCGWHPRDQFYDSGRGDWPRSLCKRCHNDQTLAWLRKPEVAARTLELARKRRAARSPNTVRKKTEWAERCERGVRLCRGCDREFPFAEFRPTDKLPHGARSRCRKCSNEQSARYASEQRQRDPERARGYGHTRRAKIRGAEVCDLTHDEWLAIRRAYGDRCAFCGIACHDRPEITPDKLTKEHDVPVSRGGWHSASNVFPACLSCNASKCDYTAAEFEARTGRRLDRGPHPLLQLRLDVHLPRLRPVKPFPIPDGWDRRVLGCEACRETNETLCKVCQRRVGRWLAGKRPRVHAPRFDPDGTELRFCTDPECATGWQPLSAFYPDARGGVRSKCKGCFGRYARDRKRVSV